MGLISTLLGKSDGPFDRRARTLVNSAQIQVTASYLPLVERFPLLQAAPPEQWDFFVTVAGVFIAATRLNNLGLSEPRKNHLMDKVASDLNEWNGDGIRAFEDCKALFDREYDRLTEVGHDAQFVAADALGIWIVWNLIGRRPTSEEEIGLVRAIGATTTHAFFGWWNG
jgi:hypothetical protein